MVPFLILLLAGVAALACYFFVSLRQSHASMEELRQKAASVLDVVAERDKVQQEKEQIRLDRQKANGEVASLETRLQALRSEEAVLEENAELRDFGFYKPRYDFADAPRYAAQLEKLRGQQKSMIQAKTAATCRIEWTVNGSRTEGRKQINQTLRLLLRAFNGECDAAISKVKYSNIATMETRIEKAYDAINKLADVQSCSIDTDYLSLKLNELYLAHEYQEKLWEEKEEQRQIREMMREEETAQRELDRARETAEREEQRYEEVLVKARQEVEKAVGEKQDKLLRNITELERLLAEAQERKARAISRAQMTRSGHVYVISNIGSFGENVFKIGMTRRLDPMDRVRELGDASVPFSFDVHAILFSDDAPGLETALHKAFHRRRVNLVNHRKEYFMTTIEEIESTAKSHGATVEFAKVPEAKEFRISHSQRSSASSQNGVTG